MADTADIDDLVDVVGDEAPDGDTGEETPDSPEGEGSPEADEADTAADDEDDTAETDDGEGEAAPAEGAPSAFDELVSKYGGDREKLATSVREQDTAISNLTAELQSIKEALKARSPEEEETAIASDPEVQELATEVTSLKSDLTGLLETQKSFVTEYGRLQVAVAELDGQLKIADDEKKPALQAERNQAIADAKNIFRENSSILREIQRAERELRSTARKYRGAIESVKTKRTQESNLALAEATFIREQRNEFNASVRAEAKTYGVDPASQRYQMLHESVKARLSSLLRSLPDDAPAIDQQEAVEKLMGELATAMGLKKSFQKKSTEKVGVTPARTLKPGLGAPTPPKKPGKGQPWTTAYVRARAKRLLG